MAMPRWWMLLAVALLEPMADLTELFIAAGTRLLTSDGKRKLKDGKRRIANGTVDSCCCVCPCINGATYCTDGPCTATVTLTDWSGVTCAGRCSAIIGATDTDINGTYDIPEHFNAGGIVCGWQDDNTTAWGYTIKFYAAGCVTVNSTETNEFERDTRIQVFHDGGGLFHRRLQFISPGHWDFFYGESASTSDTCVASETITNALPGGGSECDVGTGGSAFITYNF